MSAESLERMMIRDDNSKSSFKPGIRILRHTLRIIRFVYTKLFFEKTFLQEYDYLKANYAQLSKRIKEEFSLKLYPEFFSQLFNEGKKLAYLNIVVPILNQLYNKRLKKKLSKRHLDYDYLDFNQDFPQLINLSPLPVIQKINESMAGLPDEIRAECISFEKLKSYPETQKIVNEINNFIKEFGHFSDSGNDFSSPKWEENPDQVFTMIRNSIPLKSKSGMYSIHDLRQKNVKVRAGLLRTYKQAGKYKVYREQISSLFIYGYGLFRMLFLSLGKELVSRNIINTTATDMTLIIAPIHA